MRYILFTLRALWLPLLLLPAACGGSHTAGESSALSHVPELTKEQFHAELPGLCGLASPYGPLRHQVGLDKILHHGVIS